MTIILLLVIIVNFLAFSIVNIIREQVTIKDYKKRLKEAPSGTFVRVGDMKFPRVGHTSIILNDGRVLIVGGNKGAVRQYKL